MPKMQNESTIFIDRGLITVIIMYIKTYITMYNMWKNVNVLRKAARK